MSGHSPAPWSNPLPYGEHDLEIVGDSRQVAIVRAKRRQVDLRLVCDGYTDQDLANARLISAAPDLLAALRLAMPYALRRNLIPDDKLRIVQAAIAKAEGQTP